MITLVKAFQASDGSTHATIEDAQRTEVFTVFSETTKTRPASTPWSITDIADAIIANREKILDILTTKKTSRPKARSINGATRKRKTTVATA